MAEENPQEAQVNEAEQKYEKDLQEVLKAASKVDGIVRGLHEVCKAVDRGTALLILLSKSCDEPNYKKLVTSLATMNSVPLLEVKDGKMLGIWVGLCKYTKKGEPRNEVRCSACAINDFGEESDHYNNIKVLMDSQSKKGKEVAKKEEKGE